MDTRYHVLFIGRDNSALSIMAETLLNHHGAARFQAFSAGAHPRDEIDAAALDVLRELQLPTEELRCKSWKEYAALAAPHMDIVVILSGRTADEFATTWPGDPIVVSWSVAESAIGHATASDDRSAYRRALLALEQRIRLLVDLPLHARDRQLTQQRLVRVDAQFGERQSQSRADLSG